MTKKFVFRARVDERHQEKIERLLTATGYNPSQLLRSLVEQAEFTLPLNVSLTRNSDVNSRQGSHVAVAL